VRECGRGARLRRLQLLNSCQTVGAARPPLWAPQPGRAYGRGATWLRLNTIRSGREALAGANTSVRPLEGPASSMKSGGVPVPVCSNAGRSTESSDDRFGIMSAPADLLLRRQELMVSGRMAARYPGAWPPFAASGTRVSATQPSWRASGGLRFSACGRTRCRWYSPRAQ
jgi:hypothetical protein